MDQQIQQNNRFWKHWRFEWFLPIALLTAALAAVTILLFFKAKYDRMAHQEATESVIEDGDSLLGTLSATDFNCSTNLTPESWKNFSDRVDSIFAVRKDIQSISVLRDGVEIFHRQASQLGQPPTAKQQNRRDIGITELEKGLINIQGKQQRVFLFSRRNILPDGTSIVTEAAVRKEAVGSKERSALHIMSSLFTISLGILMLSFVTCAVVLGMAAVRERRREERSRKEEHLAFSGVLANGILHDFRNPMSAVRLDAQMLGKEMKRPDGFRPERAASLASRIARTMERMDKIFHEFLFLAKPADEQPEEINISDAIRECVDTLSPRFEQACVAPALEVADDLFAKGYPAAFRRALINVLVNAIQFSPKNSQVKISLRPDGEKLRLTIHDEGPGISPKDREKIFDLFVTGRPEGTGLGLFLARTAIERCGGKIRVIDSESGATIEIELQKREGL